jgi:hypothetical protein
VVSAANEAAETKRQKAQPREKGKLNGRAEEHGANSDPAKH